ncbi:tyrosinase cofactor [Streptomyces sp. NPDC056519]|uniref:apotyrosinase chaperone MelC1 n=1 Tax=Streptomyces sp. NPDC056519 TaxID=3345849 RepID=UPI00368D2EDB
MNTITRRQALTAAAGTTLTVLGLSVAATAGAAPRTAPVPAAGSAAADEVDEIYEGRRIQITPGSGGGSHGGHHGGSDAPTVRIDGMELHVMRNADGSWISVINHYLPCADPLALARTAVRELQGAVLVPFQPMGGVA